MIATTGSSKHPLQSYFGEGAVFVHFQRRKKGRVVQFSEDRKAAQVWMSAAYAGANGSEMRFTLRKFGSDWVVVQAATTGVS